VWGAPAAGELRLEQVEFAAGALAELLVEEASFAHIASQLRTQCSGAETADFAGSVAIKVPDIRSCQVKPSLSNSAHRKPSMRAVMDTK
jgi:hypothetical protein